jgi:hypothetical protein
MALAMVTASVSGLMRVDEFPPMQIAASRT